ncbi:MAG: hypothetical protein QM749_05000 [Aquabacterium sp.]
MRHQRASSTTPTASRGRRAWRAWVGGGIAGGALAMLALTQLLDNDVSAATLINDVLALPDNVASAPSSEIAQALPFP